MYQFLINIIRVWLIQIILHSSTSKSVKKFLLLNNYKLKFSSKLTWTFVRLKLTNLANILFYGLKNTSHCLSLSLSLRLLAIIANIFRHSPGMRKIVSRARWKQVASVVDPLCNDLSRTQPRRGIQPGEWMANKAATLPKTRCHRGKRSFRKRRSIELEYQAHRSCTDLAGLIQITLWMEMK